MPQVIERGNLVEHAVEAVIHLRFRDRRDLLLKEPGQERP